jgi:putative SOS response-associated peptidase YedK
VTHAAGPGVVDVHDRAPIVLPADAGADWLNPRFETPQDLLTEASAPNAYTVEYAGGPQ